VSLGGPIDAPNKDKAKTGSDGSKLDEPETGSTQDDDYGWRDHDPLSPCHHLDRMGYRREQLILRNMRVNQDGAPVYPYNFRPEKTYGPQIASANAAETPKGFSPRIASTSDLADSTGGQDETSGGQHQADPYKSSRQMSELQVR